ncbi:MAG: type I-B CRISPR-associated endonuclease Cas1b [Balneolia bacterium]|nr:type I-B CRISPR-associated endonuclease Cas1b [Balneolia bacterium]
MPKSAFYIFEPVTLKRKDNTLGLLPFGNSERDPFPGEKIARELADEFPLPEEDAWWNGAPRFVPVERVESIHAYSSVRLNTALLNFLAEKHIPLHTYNFFGGYTGSYWPKEPIPNGKIQQAQFMHFAADKDRVALAREMLAGAFHNMHSAIMREQRKSGQYDDLLDGWKLQVSLLNEAKSVDTLLGIEGSIRRVYYEFLDRRITPEFSMGNRTYNPPNNPVNALISYLNSMLYAAIISELYRTQLNPLVGFLHQPGRKRFPLAWDMAEIFRPLLVEGLVISLLNKKQLKASDFDESLNGCMLLPEGRVKVIRAFEHRMNKTIKHRSLGRSVSYRRLIRLEGYKLVKHLLGDQDYVSFRIWW